MKHIHNAIHPTQKPRKKGSHNRKIRFVMKPVNTSGKNYTGVLLATIVALVLTIIIINLWQN